MLKMDAGFRYLKRFRQIFFVFAKFGFGRAVDRLNVVTRFGLPRRRPSVSMAEGLRLALEELGPTFVKLGQVLSVRADVFPPEFIEELAKLQDEVSPLPFETIQAVVEEELGHPVEELFRSLERKPVASASLAQVHRAVTRNGDDVVVKVQRPNIRHVVETDLQILLNIAHHIERQLEETKRFEPVEKAREVGRILRGELNFINEARNIDRFRRNFEDDEMVLVPGVYWDLTTPKVLTLERIEGVKISDVEELKKAGLDPREIASRGVDAVLRQIFIHGFFHGDPHPGNVLVTAEGKIVPLDFGMMGSLDDETMVKLGDLLVSTVKGDIERIVDGFLDLGALEEEVNRERFASELRGFRERYYSVTVKRLDIHILSDEVFEIARKYGLKLPRDFILLAKALSTIEGIGVTLDPEFSMAEHTKPFIEELAKRRYEPTRLIKISAETVRDYGRLLRALPRDLLSVLKKADRGRLRLEVEDRRLYQILNTAARAANRLVIGFIIAALIVGSSLVMQTERGPLVLGFPVFGIVGLLIAALLGLSLAISVVRGRRP